MHYENLKLYESHGIKITKIHRGIKFEESAWLEEYDNLNTKLRIEAKQSRNNFEVDFFKLMNNSVFRKTLENITNRVYIRLILSDKVAQKLAAKSNYDRCKIFDENLIAVHMKKTKLYFNKCVYLGMSILLTWVNPWCMIFITTILKPNMGVRQNYSSKTPTLSHMKLRQTIFTKISTPILRNGLILVTTRLIIDLELNRTW